ncbi:acyltransferase [Pedobacter frigidisoli]|uniref:Acyltransferase n=1 Tax=Pedobacter frigidisoli TaxID=2530455 RepID=A0A4V2MMQ1_9SPHI|nr:acyltransferase [Pedobacter frigidisoli]TCD07726.1 acyltransferase [Pedobacter frigidisoli]
MLKFFSFLYTIIFKIAGISVGKNVLIKPLSFMSRGFLNGKKGEVIIEDDCEISQGAILKSYGGKIHLKQNTFLGEYVVIYGHGNVEIGENTLIAMHTCILSSNHTIPDRRTNIRSQGDILLPVKIGDDVWIGAGVKILGGVEIGDGCVIGAGAVVSKNIPPYSIAVGVPSKIIGTRND